MSIGNECFKYQDVLNLTGLHTLESVSIGMNCFTKKTGQGGNDANRKLYVKDCEELKELRMGRYSFSDYSVIEIENVDKLEVLEIGDLESGSFNFYYASLELKSAQLRVLLMCRLTAFEITSLWQQLILPFFSSCVRE